MQTTVYSISANPPRKKKKQLGAREVVAYLVTDPAIRNIMPRINLTNVYYHTEKVVCASPSQLGVVFGILTPSAISIREHIKLQGEGYGCLDFSRPLIPALLVLKSLCYQVVND